MPRFNRQLGSQSVVYRLQTRRQHLLHILRREHLFDFALFVAVDRRAESMTGNKAVYRVSRLEPYGYFCGRAVRLRSERID